MSSDLLNLEKQLRFYGAYHHNTINILIHVTFVPILLWTGLLLGTNTPALPVPEWLQIPNLPYNLTFFFLVAYCLLYVLLEPVAGGVLSALIIAGTAYANTLTKANNPQVNYYAAGAHIFSWVVQFYGHGAHEGRAPALLDNLFQAIFLAPLFVWLEMLFSFGYRSDLKKRLDVMVEEDIAKFRQSKINGHTNGKATNGHTKIS